MRVIKLAASLILGAVVCIAGLTGCSGFFTSIGTGTGGTGSSSYVYVANSGGTVAEYSLASGVLTALSGSPVSLTLAPYSIAEAPNDTFVYIGTGTGVFLYTIGSDGTLTEGNGDNVAYINATNPSLIAESMVIDSTNSWLIIAYQNSTEIDAVQLTASTGLPTGNVFSVTTTNSTMSPQLAISPANTQVYVALGTGGTEAFGFTATGTTAPKGPWGTAVGIPLATGNTNGSDAAVAVDPTSKYVYVAEQNTNSSGTAVAGTVRILGTADLGTVLDTEAVGIGPTALLPDATGAYVYVANGADGTISGFTLNTTTQKLTTLGSTFPTEQSPIGLVEDSSKAYVMAVGNRANPNLWLYSFDSTNAGALDVSSTKSTASTNPSLATGIAISH